MCLEIQYISLMGSLESINFSLLIPKISKIRLIRFYLYSIYMDLNLKI